MPVLRTPCRTPRARRPHGKRRRRVTLGRTERLGRRPEAGDLWHLRPGEADCFGEANEEPDAPPLETASVTPCTGKPCHRIVPAIAQTPPGDPSIGRLPFWRFSS